MADGGIIFGYFLALLVLTMGPALILIVMGWFRWRKSEDCSSFDSTLAKEARDAIGEHRADIMRHLTEDEERRSFSNSFKDATETISSSLRLGLINSTEKDDSGLMEGKLLVEYGETEKLEYYRKALNDNHAYFGVDDIILKDGLISTAMCCPSCCKDDPWTMLLPAGLFEDFIFYICNTVNPLPFIFGDKLNPVSTFARFVSYSLSQAFAIMIFLYLRDIRMTAAILLTPLILFLDTLFYYLLVCPCLQDEKEEESSSTTRTTGKVCLRALGGLLTFPFLLGIFIIFVVTALWLSRNGSKNTSLAMYLWNGICFPFLLKLFWACLYFCYFAFPLHVNCCGCNILRMNRWVEDQLDDSSTRESLAMDLAERNGLQALRRRRIAGEAEICLFNCRCCTLRGLDDDSHNTLEICRPYWYCHRGYEQLMSLYFEESSPQRDSLRKALQSNEETKRRNREMKQKESQLLGCVSSTV